MRAPGVQDVQARKLPASPYALNVSKQLSVAGLLSKADSELLELWRVLIGARGPVRVVGSQVAAAEGVGFEKLGGACLHHRVRQLILRPITCFSVNQT